MQLHCTYMYTLVYINIKIWPLWRKELFAYLNLLLLSGGQLINASSCESSGTAAPSPPHPFKLHFWQFKLPIQVANQTFKLQFLSKLETFRFFVKISYDKYFCSRCNSVHYSNSLQFDWLQIIPRYFPMTFGIQTTNRNILGVFNEYYSYWRRY